MSRKIVADELFEDVTVDLWGHQFELLEVTRKVEAKLDGLVDRLQVLQEKAEEAEEEPAIADLNLTMVEMYGDMLDVILKPAPANGSKATRAKTVLMGKFKADEIGLGRIINLVEHIQEASSERGRPTSAQTSDG